jgi:hypothetical protein
MQSAFELKTDTGLWKWGDSGYWSCIKTSAFPSSRPISVSLHSECFCVMLTRKFIKGKTRILVNVRIYAATIRLSLTTEINLPLVDFQLDAQNSYLFMHNTFIKILYVFRALLCSSSGGLRRNFIYAASGIVTLQVTVLCTGWERTSRMNGITD